MKIFKHLMILPILNKSLIFYLSFFSSFTILFLFYFFLFFIILIFFFFDLGIPSLRPYHPIIMPWCWSLMFRILNFQHDYIIGSLGIVWNYDSYIFCNLILFINSETDFQNGRSMTSWSSVKNDLKKYMLNKIYA